MRFVPVQFRQADSAILQTDSRNALELTPATAPVNFPQSHHITDRTMDRHSLNVMDITDNFEFHCVSISSEGRLLRSRLPPHLFQHFIEDAAINELVQIGHGLSL